MSFRTWIRLAASAAPDLHSGMDLSRLLRILREWRLLIIASGVSGLLIGIAMSLIVTPMYRAGVVLEANPPSVQVIDEKTQSTAPAGRRLGLRRHPDRPAGKPRAGGARRPGPCARQQPRVRRPERRPGAAHPGRRPARSPANLQVAPQTDGQLIRFAFIWQSPEMAATVANAYANAFIDASLQRRYDASAYARSFLKRQIASTRNELEKSERQLVSYAQAQGIINTGTGDSEQSTDANSPQGQSLISLNEALAQATARRVAAEGRLPRVDVERADQRRDRQQPGDPPVARAPRGRISAEAHDAEARPSGNDQPALADRRARPADRPRELQRRQRAGQRHARRISGRRGRRAGAPRGASPTCAAKCSTCAGGASNMRSCSATSTPTGRSMTRCFSATRKSALPAASARRRSRSSTSAEPPASAVQAQRRAQRSDRPRPRPACRPGRGDRPRHPQRHDPHALRTSATSSGCPASARFRGASGAAKRTTLLEELDDPTSPASESYATLATSLQFTTDEGVPHALLVTSARAAEGKSSTALAISPPLRQARQTGAADRRRFAQAELPRQQRGQGVDLPPHQRGAAVAQRHDDQISQFLAAPVRRRAAQPGRAAGQLALPRDHRRSMLGISTWSSSIRRRCSASPTRR